MKSIKTLVVYILVSLFNISFVMADFLPPQPGDPGTTMSVPIDGGILMSLLAVAGFLSLLIKKKKKDS